MGVSVMIEAWRPEVIDAAAEPDRLEAARRAAVFVHDPISAQLRDLARARSPEVELEGAELDAAACALLNGQSAEEFGRWVVYPWSGRVVHLLGPEAFRELRSDRNRHKLTAAEQTRLREVSIGIAGLSVGNAIALTLALEGVGGHLRLADFDRLELSNMNRIRAGVQDIGGRKVVLAARQIAEVDPYLAVSIMPDGVTPDNVDEFLRGGAGLGPGLDIVVEECDGIALKFLIRERARELRLPVIMETSDRGLLDVERFDLEPDRGLLHGRMDGATSAEVAARLTGPKRVVEEHKAALVVGLLDGEQLSARMAGSMVEVDASVSSWAQLASDVVLGGASVTVAARRLALGLPLPSGRRISSLSARWPGLALHRPCPRRGRGGPRRARGSGWPTQAASTRCRVGSAESSSTRCWPPLAATCSRGTSIGTSDACGSSEIGGGPAARWTVLATRRFWRSAPRSKTR